MQDSSKQSDRFFFYYTATLLLLVLTGFAPSFFARVIFQTSPMPVYLHVHGALLTAWFVLLLVQASLIRSGKPGAHRRLGRFVAAYAAVVAVGALMATFNYVSRELASGATFETDMGQVNAQQASGMSFLDFSTALVWFNMASIVCFALLLALAVLSRKKADAHKRFMLFASLSIIAPAVARISRIVAGTEQGPIIPLGLMLLVLLIVIYDLSRLKKIHRATLISIGLLVALNAVAGLIALSPLGRAFVKSLA